MTVDVGAAGDFRHGRLVPVTVDGREVGIIRWADRVYAIRTICPHESSSLCAGVVRARLTGEGGIGTMQVDQGQPVLACPWHGWEFDLGTGRAIWDNRYRVKVYEVTLKDDRVLVDVGRAPGRTAGSRVQEG